MVAAISLLAVAVLCLAGSVVWYGMAWRMGWFNGPPRMAANVWPIPGDYSPSWSRRLRERFPIGSMEAGLETELTREGFDVDVPHKRAAYGWAARPCVYTLTVTWRGDAAKRVRDVQGGLLNACTDPRRLIPDRPVRRRVLPPLVPDPQPIPAGSPT